MSKKHQFTQMYLDALRKTLPQCLLSIQQDPNKDRDLEFGEIVSRKHEWRTRFAYNKVTHLFILLLDNADDERYIFFTYASPVAAIKYVGLVDYNEGKAFNCESGEWEPAFDDILAVVKMFSHVD